METTRSQIQYFSNLGRDTTSSDFFFLVVDNLLKFRQNRLTTKRYQNELCTCYHGAVRNAVKKKKKLPCLLVARNIHKMKTHASTFVKQQCALAKIQCQNFENLIYKNLSLSFPVPMNGKTFIMYLLNQYSKYIRIFTINAKRMYAFSPHFQN